MEKKFISNAEEIRYYTKQLLNDGMIHTKSEIRDYIRQHSDLNFTEGMLSGALYDLVNNNRDKYISTERGKYQKTPLTIRAEEQIFKTKAILVIETCMKTFIDLCTINVMTLSEKDLKIVQKISRITQQLEVELQEINKI